MNSSHWEEFLHKALLNDNVSSRPGQDMLHEGACYQLLAYLSKLFIKGSLLLCCRLPAGQICLLVTAALSIMYLYLRTAI